MNYTFQSNSFRAKCVKVVDGDTVDLYVDLGFHSFRKERFRLLGIDAPEMKGSEKEQGQTSKLILSSILMSSEEEWPLRIETQRDPDNFGRWLIDIFVIDNNKEVSVNKFMIDNNFAKPYIK